MTTLAATPLPATWTVREARAAYLAENGFTVEGYDDRWTKASFLGIPLVVLNTKRHRWAIMLHDLHHIATGFGTNLVGESEISIWELREGWRHLGLYVGSIVFTGALMGISAPSRAASAWRAAKSSRSLFSLFPEANDAAYEALLDLTVGELRARLGIPREGATSLPRGRHHYAPAQS